MSSNLDREDDQFLADIVHIVRAFLRDRPEDAAGLRQAIEWEWAARRYARVYVRVLDEAGQSLIETAGMSTELQPDLFPSPIAVSSEPDLGVEAHGADGALFRVLAARAAVGSGRGRTRVIQVALDQAREQTLLAEYRQRLWVVLSVSLVACTVVGYGIARRGIRPVREIAQTAERISSSTLNSRIDLTGLPAELSALAETFNRMLEGLEDSFERLSRFSADIAHELRTPINNLRGEAEVALNRRRTPAEYQEVLASLLEECLRLSQMIDSLLFVARAESPQTEIARERVNISRELSLVRDFYEPAAAEASVNLTVAAPDTLSVEVDRTLFQRAVSNLVANALGHTPPGGHATIKAVQDGATVRVEVLDTGHGIPPEHLSRVFDRFYRIDGSRSAQARGLGLGLAIVRSIVRLHGGSVEITSEPGFGTCVSLSFPASLPAHPAARMTVS